MKTVEDVQEYWDSRPCNIRHSSAPVGSKEYFSDVTRRRYFVEPHILEFAQFPRWAHSSVLEVGCGIGTDTVQFAKYGAHVTGVELSEVSLGVTKQRIALHRFKNVELYSANAESLIDAVPVKEYDLIYSFGVVHHTPHPEKVMSELLAYCGPRTELRIMLYAKWSWKVLWIIARYGKFQFWKVNELVPRYSEAQIGSPVSFVYTFKEVRKLLKDFDIISMKKRFIFSYVIEKYKQYEYQRVWYFRWMPGFLFDWLQALLGWHILIVAKPKL